MWDSNFDPLEILNKLNENVNIVYNNTVKHEREITELRQQLKNQQEIIDLLVDAVNASSASQEQMLKNFLGVLERGIKKND